jgi:hypothetical protein
MRGGDGRYMMSQNGTRYFQYLKEATEAHGIQGTDRQHAYAIKMLENDALRYQIQQYQSGQVPQQAQQQVPGMQMAAQQQAVQQGGGVFIPPGAGHQPNVNSLQQQTPAYRKQVQPTVDEPTGGKSLYELMREGFAGENITDQMVREDMTRRQSPLY